MKTEKKTQKIKKKKKKKKKKKLQQIDVPFKGGIAHENEMEMI
jgi:hypothetical protein